MLQFIGKNVAFSDNTHFNQSLLSIGHGILQSHRIEWQKKRFRVSPNARCSKPHEHASYCWLEMHSPDWFLDGSPAYTIPSATTIVNAGAKLADHPRHSCNSRRGNAIES